MKDEPITVRRRKADKKLVRALPDGPERPLADSGVLAHHYESIFEAAMERARKLKRAPRVKVMRKALGLTEEAFAAHTEHMGLRYDRLKELAAKVAGKLVALKPEFEIASDERF